MSRRRNRKNRTPNIPESTLKRARRQAGIEDDAEQEELAEDAAEEAAEAAEAAAVVDEPEDEDDGEDAESSAEQAARRERIRSNRRQARLSPAQLDRAKKRGDLDQETISELLANPTRYVSEEDLREEYGFVLVDLRNMGLLAGGLLVVLVLLAQLL